MPKSVDDGRAVAQQHVLRLDVAVHDAEVVRARERLRDVAKDARRLAPRERALGESLPERCAAHVRHRVEGQLAGRRAGGEHGNDVRILERRRELDLAREPFGRERGRELGSEHLHDDIAAERFVACDEDPAHPAAAKLSDDRVVGAECGLQLTGETITHGAGR